MADDGDGGAIGILLVVVCCIFACIIGLLVWANGGPEKLGLTSAQIDAAVAGIEFTQAIPPNVVLSNVRGLGSYSYNRIFNAATIDPSDMGSPVSGKTADQCDSLCHATSGCYGYTIDGDKCQLKNNVTLVRFQPGASNLYASQDIGGVLYEHFPYQKVNLGEPRLWTFNGPFADAVANCHSAGTTCKGFTWDGGTSSTMYAAVTALDGGTAGSGHTYTRRDALPTFISFPNQSYSDSPDETKTTNPAWTQEQPFNPRTDADYFVTWQNGWDAGTDAYGEASRTANTITVQNLAQCQNACVANAWCGSFVINTAGTQCYLRHGASPKSFPDVDSGGNPCVPYSDGASVNCRCGLQSGSLTSCKGFTAARQGTSDGSKNTYVKKQPPLGLFCAGSCKNDPECRVATYKPTSGECKIYRSLPSNKVTNDSTSNTVWMVDYFPG